MTGDDVARPRRETDLPFARPFIGEEEIAEVVDTLRSGWLTTGPRSRLFEQEFAAATGGASALAVSSGTAALHLGLVVGGVGPGQLVFTTPTTFCASAHVIEHVGATPVLVDIDPRTLNVDAALMEAAVEAALARGAEPPAALLPVHFAGQPCDMEAILSLARRHDLQVVEDAAHAFGTARAGVPVGTVDPTVRGHVAAFSLYATKNITTGEGGVLTGEPAFVDRAREWSLHGMSRDAWRRYERGGSWRYDVLHAGFKYNFTDLQAALGLAQLRRASALQDRRRLIAERYTAAFAELDELEVPETVGDVEHAWHLYVLRMHLDRLSIGRDEFIHELTGLGIGTSVHFIPLHELSYYREKYAFEPGSLPVADREFQRMLSLPIYPAMSDGDVEDVVAAVRDVVTRHRVAR
jgi:dTDP-4-amino-4,6-dideoxygalactose transaminase